MYGLSGTSGMLKYIICKMYLSFISKDNIAVYGVTASDQLKIGRDTRNSTSTILQRSLSSLYQKHHEFQLNGANLKKAKFLII